MFNQPMRCFGAGAVSLIASVAVATETGAQSTDLPFRCKIETYRAEDGDEAVFALKLEQPFLAEEFEQSNYLRLRSLDDQAYLIYPRQTRFEQKHAAFYGRLRGTGETKVEIAYENVTENLDGSRRVTVRSSELAIPIPAEPTGARTIYTAWAEQQNAHFLDLLSYYPNDSFLQYALLQSRERYGVEPPRLPTRATEERVRRDLYSTFSGALAIQEALQRRVLGGDRPPAPLTVHISSVRPPRVPSPDYAKLLEARLAEGYDPPRRHVMAGLVPEDQYLLQFHSPHAAAELYDLSRDWGGSLLRAATIKARDAHPLQRFERQLGITRESILDLFDAGVIGEIGITGNAITFADGADVTLIMRVLQTDEFDAAVENWHSQPADPAAGYEDRQYNYRGYAVRARYTPDRTISAFTIRHQDYAVFSNSPAVIRRIVDTVTGAAPALYDASDYRYLVSLLPVLAEPDAGYLYASDAFLRQQISPAAKIAEKRRRECLNNLVMLNNASLLYRLEYGRSPQSLSELFQQRFIEPDALVCPHGGGYAFDPDHDAGTCSVHNRLNYLSPTVEQEVLKVSSDERDQYATYREQYESFWGTVFDPIAVRLRVGDRVSLESCVLPLSSNSVYNALRDWVAREPRPLSFTPTSEATIASLYAVPGRERLAGYVGGFPGMRDVLEADPTLTDLKWVGERVSLHLADGDTIIEVDPTELETLNIFRPISVSQQSLAATALLAMNLPAYLAIEIEDGDKARRFLELLSSKIFLRGDVVWGFDTAFDAYRAPDYRGYATYVLSHQVYAIKLRLHVALVGDHLVAATRARTLRSVIDAAEAPPSDASPAHLELHVNLDALQRFEDDLRLYWAEKSRLACHANIMSIYHLSEAYDTPIDRVDALSRAKYGVQYFCPEGGRYDSEPGGFVACSLHGNRRHSRQNLAIDADSTFSRLIDSLRTVEASLEFSDEYLRARVDIQRAPQP